MKIFTIGFTKSSAQQFFSRLKHSGAKKVIDVRLNNVSQLAGFAKREDLRYFTKKLCGLDYEHMLQLAPTQDMLDKHKKQGGDWDAYAQAFLALMEKRRIEDLERDRLDGGCLLAARPRRITATGASLLNTCAASGPTLKSCICS